MKNTLFYRRLLISVSLTLVILFISCAVGWLYTGRAFYDNTMLQLWTQLDIRELNAAIVEYEKASSSPPLYLEELQLPSRRIRPSKGHALVKKDGVFVDGWGRPYYYSSNGESYTLRSFGRDGEIRGLGLDRDLTHWNDRPERYDQYGPRGEKAPSFQQFFFELPTEGILLTCSMLSIVGGLVIFMLVREGDLSGENGIEFWIKITVTVVASVVIATIMSIGHIPS